MSKLIAKCPVLYQSRMYAPGDPLPAHDPVMSDAWLEAGTAVLVNEPEDETGAFKDQEININMKLADLQKIATKYGIDASKMQRKADVIAAIKSVLLGSGNRA